MIDALVRRSECVPYSSGRTQHSKCVAFELIERDRDGMRSDERLFDNVAVEIIPDRDCRVLNALDVSLHRCMSKYEVIFQIIDQDKIEMNQNLVLLVWELVDWLERTRRIMHLGTGFSKTTKFRKIENSLRSVTDLRHTLQHFDNFIKDSRTTDFAPLGAVTAFHRIDSDEFRLLVFNPGLVRADTDLGGARIPETMTDRVDHVTLMLDKFKLNLSPVMRNLHGYYEELRELVSERYPAS